MTLAEQFIAVLKADTTIFAKTARYAKHLDPGVEAETEYDLYFVTFSDGSQACMYSKNRRRKAQFANKVWITK